MSFNRILDEGLLDKGFSAAPRRLSSKEQGRDHMSFSKILANDNSIEILTGTMEVYKYAGQLSRRYLFFRDLSYDFAITVYDNNTSGALILKLFDCGKDTLKAVRAKLATFKNPNFEARVIGLQTNQDFACMARIADYLIDSKINIVDVDLFGTDTRQIAFDLKLGTAYNVLMQDKIYKAGENKTAISYEEFAAKVVETKL
jgi:hypothetical protein